MLFFGRVIESNPIDPNEVNPYRTPSSSVYKPVSHSAPAQQGTLFSWPTTIILGLLVPGLAYWRMLRTPKSLNTFLFLFSTIPVAFLFYGPFWDLVLFKGTPYNQAGLYPFLLKCALVPLASLFLAVKARRVVGGVPGKNQTP